jgi:hypothetical protein
MNFQGPVNNNLELKITSYICVYIDANRYNPQETVFSNLSDSLTDLVQYFLEKNRFVYIDIIYPSLFH